MGVDYGSSYALGVQNLAVGRFAINVRPSFLITALDVNSTEIILWE